MGDGIRNKYTIIIQGDGSSDTAKIHRENAELAEHSSLFSGSKIIKIDPLEGSAKAIKMAEAVAGQVDDDDEVNFYLTGHGELNGEEPYLVMDGGNLYASSFVDVINKIKCETTVIADQCYSANFGRFLAKAPNVRFIGLSGKDLADHCRPFADRIFNPPKEADDDHDGRISWVEAFDWATEDSGVSEYSLSTYFSGKHVSEKNFPSKHVTAAELGITSKEDLNRYLSDIEAGQYVIVMFSATEWCIPCRKEEPEFIKAANGKYQFLLVDDPDVMGKYDIDSVPQKRIYGKGLSPEGIILPGSIKNALPNIPLYILDRDQLALAEKWLANGTVDEKYTAIDIYKALAKKGQKEAIVKLLKALSDENEWVQVKAILSIAEVAPDTKELGPAISKSLGSADFQIRRQALFAIETVGKVSQEILHAVVEMLDDKDPEVSVIAAETLIRSSASAPIQKISSLMFDVLKRNDVKAKTRMRAASILKDIYYDKGVDRNSIKDIVPIIASLIYDDYGRAAMHTLSDLGAIAEDAVPKLMDLLEDRTQDIAKRNDALHAIEGIYFQGSQEKSLAILYAVATDHTQDAVLRSEAIKMLAAMASQRKEVYATLSQIILDKDEGSEVKDVAKEQLENILNTTIAKDYQSHF